mgnify:FL=1
MSVLRKLDRCLERFLSIMDGIAAISVFGIMILVIVLGYIPWSSIPVGDHTMYDVVNAPASWLGEHVPFIGHLLGTAGFTYLGDWYFDEFSIVFLDWFSDCSSD